MTKFIHLRLYDSWAGRMYEKGGATVAYDLVDNPDSGTTIQYATSMCSMKDNYNKTIGRKVADGRLQARGNHVTVLPYKQDSKVVDQIVKDLSFLKGKV